MYNALEAATVEVVPPNRSRVTQRQFTTASGDARPDVYTRVTQTIVAALERGVAPWVQPWAAAHDGQRIIRPLRHTGQPYNGVNVLLLWGAALEQGFQSSRWMTFKQAHALGAHVRKGERGALVVYASTYQTTEPDADGHEVERDVPFLKAYTVFNTEQIDGLPAQYCAMPPPTFAHHDARLAHADTFFAHLGATILTRGYRAAYAPAADHILMPPFATFRDAESYYATLAHEAVHWTKHETRLARDFGRKSWGDAGYAAEELVAELGAAYLCADLELRPEVSDDHAAYLAHWLRVLKQDARAIFSAAAYAQRAVDFLHARQPRREVAPDAPTP